MGDHRKLHHKQFMDNSLATRNITGHISLKRSWYFRKYLQDISIECLVAKGLLIFYFDQKKSLGKLY
jgi:hypothetical protein